MPALPHLILPRAEYDLPRKKRKGYGYTPYREHSSHGRTLSDQLDQVLTQFQSRRRSPVIDPSLILRIQLDPKSKIPEDVWERCSMVLLSVDENNALVLFSSDTKLTDFKDRLHKYIEGPSRPEQKNAPYTQIFACIDNIGEIRPQDRIGRLFRSKGIRYPDQFLDEEEYIIDIELWDCGDRGKKGNNVDQITIFIQQHGGRVTDRYIGESMVLIRARCFGKIIKELLEMECISVLDQPPKPSLTVSELLDIGMEDISVEELPRDGVPGVAILDSGLTTGHPLIGPAVGEATSIPKAWADASDGHGHGTMVAGIALYGNVEECIRNHLFAPRLNLYSARVLNDHLKFDDESLIITQMREAIHYFRETYNCRVFNISLGDERLPYRDGKVSHWASILDTLARELDIIIVVSAGNYEHIIDSSYSVDSYLQDYPRYLLDDNARIIEPATGLIVLTVGALAHSSAIPPGSAADNVAFRPIAQQNQPSPFTRCGPGLDGAIKPELCEIGGNYVFDGLIKRCRKIRECSVVSMNRQYSERLFNTDIGTSYAAPKVAHAAAQLFGVFPDASANLIRALLVSSAQIPDESIELFTSKGMADDVMRVCGYGRPIIEHAMNSDNSRVVLCNESELAFDNFHIYEVPIPDELIQEKGLRSISVTLAYDPPVRHTRIDYMGVKMSFRLIRGKTLDEVAEAFRSRNQGEGHVGRLSSTRYDCKMNPNATSREGGTLQKATLIMQKKPTVDYGDTYYLVVRCERKWAREEHAPQKYAVVVVMEHSAQVDLYNTIRNRIVTRLRVRSRG